MDWQALMPEGQPAAVGTAAPAHETPDKWEQFPLKTPICSHLGGGGESCNINTLSDLFPVFPPSEVSLGLNASQNAPGVAGRPVQIRARNEGDQPRFPLHPAGVVLCLAWCNAVGADPEERTAALEAMTTAPPGEQVKRWHGACIERGLKPWELIYMKAPTEGTECGKCKHLVSREYRHPDERRRFHWACALGYLLHEYGSGSERVWVAPPECLSWERLQPAR